MEQKATGVDWAFACDYALIDQMGKISIIGIFDKLYSAAYPTVHPVLYLAAAWRGPSGQMLMAEVRLWSPAKELIATMQQQIGFGPDGRSTGLFRMSPVPIPAPGEYIFDFLAGAESVKQLPFEVTNPPQQ